MSKPCSHCGAFGGTTAIHLPNCITVLARGSREDPPRVPAKFVAVRKTVMYGDRFIADVVSHTMALRIANALNSYVPNRKGF